ncbi:MAG: leucine-rich repeat domain-containing protein [Clostridia bacterium]|nr:leucine-rich repeat domain-containing protein [Clostridia bacterium]
MQQRMLILAIAICLFACLFTACDTQEHVCAFGEWAIVKQPTCVEQGQQERFCSCGEKQTSSLAVTGHSYTHVVTDPTCTEQGFTTHTCHCGDSYVDTYVDATGHAWKWVVDTEATVIESGLKHEECSVCHAKQNENTVIEPLECSHEGTLVHHAKVEAACIEDGTIEYWHCTTCDKKYTDATGQSLAQSLIIPSVGCHNFYQSDTCGGCGQNISDVAEKSCNISDISYRNVMGYVVPRQDGNYDVYIKGTGMMMDYAFSSGPLENYSDRLVNVYIDNSVNSIGDYAFEDCEGLESIDIPDSVLTIGYRAFRNCTSLTSITIPNGVMIIENGAFYGCDSLKSVTFGENSQLTDIWSEAFSDCDSLTSIVIPNSVTEIGDEAFYGCMNLTNITIPNSVTDIGNEVFSGCSKLIYNIYDNGKYLGNETNPYLVFVKATSTSITSCEIHDSCRFVMGGAFTFCDSLISVAIGNSVTTIGDGAFAGCSGLTSVTFGENSQLTSIRMFAFCGCDGLKSIILPNSVTTIGNYAFEDCDSLISVTFVDPTGWYVSTISTATSGTNLTLTNASTNATYLKSTYYYYYWYKK